VVVEVIECAQSIAFNVCVCVCECPRFHKGQLGVKSKALHLFNALRKSMRSIYLLLCLYYVVAMLQMHFLISIDRLWLFETFPETCDLKK